MLSECRARDPEGIRDEANTQSGSLNQLILRGQKLSCGTSVAAPQSVPGVPRNVDVTLPGKGNSNSHGVRPVWCKE